MQKNNFYLFVISVLSIGFLMNGLSYQRSNIAWAQQTEKDLFFVAQKAFDDSFYDVASRYIEQLLADYPNTEYRAQATLILGQCLFFQEKYLAAFNQFNKINDDLEYRDAMLFWIGETRLKGGDYEQALQSFDDLIIGFPNSIYTPQAIYSKGWIQIRHQKYNKAIEILEYFLKNYPDHQLAEDAMFKKAEALYHSQEYAKAADYFKQFVLIYPDSNRHAEAYFFIGESLYYESSFLEASTYYARASDLSYDNNLILMSKVNMGWCFLKIKRYKMAKERFAQAEAFALEKSIVTDDIYFGLGNLYSDTNEPELALQAYQDLIENFPNSIRLPEAYLGLANTLYLLKRFDESITTYQRFLSDFSDKVENHELVQKAYFGLAWAYLKNGDIDKCIETFEAVKGKTNSRIIKISALTQIGDAYQDSDQLVKAIDIYDRILNEYPDSAYSDYVQYRLGIALLKQDRINAATLAFESLKNYFPKSRYINDIKYYLGLAYYKKGEWDLARDHIQAFITTVETDNQYLPESYYILGMSEFYLENYTKAQTHFKMIIDNFPERQSLLENASLTYHKAQYQKGETAKAITDFKRLLFKYADAVIAQDIIRLLANHYFNTGDHDQAIAYYYQFINKFPGSEQIGEVLYELAQVFLSRQDYDEAVNVLKRIDEAFDPELYGKARMQIGDILSQNINDESAISIYESIIKTSPEFKREAYVKIAQIRRTMDQYKEAITSYRLAINDTINDLDSFDRFSNAEIQFYIADTYEVMNSAEDAVDEYFKIPYLYPDERNWIIKAYLRIARIFEDREQFEEARKAYQMVVDMDVDETKFAQERIKWLENQLSI